jgi:hypothetical protein
MERRLAAVKSARDISTKGRRPHNLDLVLTVSNEQPVADGDIRQSAMFDRRWTRRSFVRWPLDGARAPQTGFIIRRGLKRPIARILAKCRLSA